MIRSRRHRPHNKINATQRNSYEQLENKDSQPISQVAFGLHDTDKIEIPVQKDGNFSHEVWQRCSFISEHFVNNSKYKYHVIVQFRTFLPSFRLPMKI